MRSHLIVIKVFFVVGAVWLYVIHPTRIPVIQKLGPSPIIEQAARFTFPEIKSMPEEDDVIKVSGEHRELSLREVSSIGKASANPTAKAAAKDPSTPHIEKSESEVQTQ